MKWKIFIFIIAFLLITLLGVVAYALHSGWFEKNTSSRTSISANAIYDGRYEYCTNPDSCNFIYVTTVDEYTRVFGQAYYLGTQQTNTGQMNGELLFSSEPGVASYNGGTCKIDLIFRSNDVTLKEKESGTCGGVNVTFDGLYEKKPQVDQRLVGVWQDSGSGASGWSDRYQFYPNGAYAFMPSQMKCDKKLFFEAGTYEIKNNTVMLTKKIQQVAIGGQLINATGSCGSKKELINSKIETQILKPPTKNMLTLTNRERKEDDNYPSLFINNIPYWKFNDPVDSLDLLPSPQFDPERCFSFTDPCMI
jgi:hypothetical protein